MANIDVMISLNVGSMNTSALWLKENLEKAGLTVWLCSVSLRGGEDYREGIANAVKNCK